MGIGIDVRALDVWEVLRCGGCDFLDYFCDFYVRNSLVRVIDCVMMGVVFHVNQSRRVDFVLEKKLG